MSALDLARLRALTATDQTHMDQDDPAARSIGRIVKRAGARAILARDPEAPAPSDLGVEVLRPTDTALIALGICIGLAWTDRGDHPYPGVAFTIDDVTAAARELGVSSGASTHLVGAVRHLLSQARYVEHNGELIRLGPAVAAWSDTDVDAFHRNLDVLPEAKQAVT